MLLLTDVAPWSTLRGTPKAASVTADIGGLRFRGDVRRSRTGRSESGSGSIRDFATTVSRAVVGGAGPCAMDAGLAGGGSVANAGSLSGCGASTAASAGATPPPPRSASSLGQRRGPVSACWGRERDAVIIASSSRGRTVGIASSRGRAVGPSPPLGTKGAAPMSPAVVASSPAGPSGGSGEADGEAKLGTLRRIGAGPCAPADALAVLELPAGVEGRGVEGVAADPRRSSSPEPPSVSSLCVSHSPELPPLSEPLPTIDDCSLALTSLSC